MRYMLDMIETFTIFTMPLLALLILLAALVLFIASLNLGMKPGQRYGIWLFIAAVAAFLCPWFVWTVFWKSFAQKAPEAEILFWQKVTFISYVTLPWIGIYFGQKCLRWCVRMKEEPAFLRVVVGCVAGSTLCAHVFYLVTAALVAWEIFRYKFF